MFWLVIMIIGGVGVYVMPPEQRARAIATGTRLAIEARDAYRNRRPGPDAFRDALAARAAAAKGRRVRSRRPGAPSGSPDRLTARLVDST